MPLLRPIACSGGRQRSGGVPVTGLHLAKLTAGSQARMTMNCAFFCQGPSPMNVRFLYAALFLLANVAAWFARENNKSYFLKQRVGGCQGDRDCFAAESVLATSHAFFLFFMVMFISTVRTVKVNDRRNSWHCGWWAMKIAVFIACSIISILIPSGWIQL